MFHKKGFVIFSLSLCWLNENDICQLYIPYKTYMYVYFLSFFYLLFIQIAKYIAANLYQMSNFSGTHVVVIVTALMLYFVHTIHSLINSIEHMNVYSRYREYIYFYWIYPASFPSWTRAIWVNIPNFNMLYIRSGICLAIHWRIDVFRVRKYIYERFGDIFTYILVHRGIHARIQKPSNL